ncbi:MULTISPECIES: hypothetical protein [unclassified Mesorhizobium]|uniref:hypothetical protein n=1 Tax=unclassified Mesorhizobium TaxID=325217 RepID=UPI00109400F6|nr:MULTISPECIES: hypothetical protein [unclassified Mesorhizobium]TGT91910.1 hypothetical protein EN804_02245 [Mesorhizobium sp. M8A.F.Ca.ET.161.01.1.1]TGV44935.1 hypothetical protein EN785_02240 [Mesorhizobium sp. M8A.F.Ca.ET.142.01.1.1]
MGAIGLLLAPAQAQDEPAQPAPIQNFKLGRIDGCFRYIGDAVEFVGHFKAGSYIGISMITIGPDGFPTPAADEERAPAMDLPEWKSASPYFWFGPTTTSRDYSITFVPRAVWGSAEIVTICGRQTPPGS